MSLGIEPKHKLTTAEKLDGTYVEDVVRYYVQQANLLAGDKTKLQILYDAAEGRMDEQSYQYVLNPYNTDNDDLKRFPARLRNFDIISPVLNLWLGEQSRKPVGGTVVATNSDSENRRKSHIAESIKGSMMQDFINSLNEMGIDTEMANQEVEAYQAQAEKANGSFDDIHAATGQEALNYLKYNLDMRDKVQSLLYDWVVGGRICTYKDVYMNDVEYEVCDPRDVYVVGWGKTPYIEDADGVVRVRRLTPSAVLDLFQDEINDHEKSDEITTWLDNERSVDGLSNDVLEIHSENIDKTQSRESYLSHRWDDSFIRVYHIVWKSFKKVGTLHYYDEFGEVQQMEVDDTYGRLNKANGDIKIDWYWINEVWEAYRLEDQYLLGGRPFRIQRNQVNNLSECKLPYNGRVLGYRNTDIVSPVQQGINYQVLYNIFHYRWELLLAKNKDKIMAMPLSLVPDGDGWNTDKFMYWMTADGVAFYDDTKPKVAALINGIKAIDMSMGNYMDKMWQLMISIKEEWWDVIGMNRQRYGDSFASDGKGNTEQAIFRSGMITADMFRQFDKTIEMDLRGILDYSKVAWLEGKKGMYINSDRRRAFLEITAEEMLYYISTDFGVFVKNSTEEYDNLQQAKQLLQTLGQNGLGAEYIIEILNANTINKVKELAKEGMAIEREFQQQQTQATNEAMIQAEEMRNKRDTEKNQTSLEVANIKAEADIEVALISADASLMDILNNTGELEQDTMAGDAIKGAIDRTQERQESSRLADNQIKDQREKEKMQMSREKMVNDLKIAKENKNQYDKKK